MAVSTSRGAFWMQLLPNSNRKEQEVTQARIEPARYAQLLPIDDAPVR